MKSILLAAVPFFGACAVVSKAGEDVKQSADSLRVGMEEVGRGLDKLSQLDPAGIRELLQRESNLRQEVEALHSRLAAFGPNKGIVLLNENSEVVFEVSGYSGSLRLSGWVDNPANKFMHNIVAVAATKTPTFNALIAQTTIENLAQRTWTANTGKPMDGWLWRQPACNQPQTIPQLQVCAAVNAFLEQLSPVRANIDDAWKLHSEAVFRDFMAHPLPVPTKDVGKSFSIDRRFFVSGTHVVFVEVTPLEMDLHGQWNLEYRCLQRLSNGTDKYLVAGRMDSLTHGASLGHSLTPEIAVAVTVNIAP